MIGIVNKLDLGERLTSSEWAHLISHEFNMSKRNAKKAVHLIMKIKKEDNFIKSFQK